MLLDCQGQNDLVQNRYMELLILIDFFAFNSVVVILCTHVAISSSDFILICLYHTLLCMAFHYNILGTSKYIHFKKHIHHP